MDFDVKDKTVLSVAELIGLATKEASTREEFMRAVQDALRQVIERYPDFPDAHFHFALGMAAGRLMAERERKK